MSAWPTSFPGVSPRAFAVPEVLSAATLAVGTEVAIYIPNGLFSSSSDSSGECFLDDAGAIGNVCWHVG